LIALGGFATAAAYGTITEAYPMVILGHGVVLLKTAAVAASALSSAAHDGVHHAAVAVLVRSAKSASRTVTFLAKVSAAHARHEGRCPLQGSTPLCPKHASLGA
jgi:hypothetical protein